jgi:anti-sigma B factor antagonist
MAVVSVRNMGDVAVLEPRGMFLGGPETDQLATTLDDLIRAGARKLLVNLARTTYLSSAPLAVLIEALNACDAKGVGMKLCCLDKKMNLVLVITRLVMRFDTYETEELALASFGAGSRLPAEVVQPAQERHLV